MILREPLRLPVEVIEVDGFPKVLAGNVPVTPINVALKYKVENRGATKASIETYTRAACLFVEFSAHRGRSLVEVTDEEFRWFTQALQGHSFPGVDGTHKFLRGQRKERTADLMITLLYSLAAELNEIYGLKLDWYRYRGASDELVKIIRATRSGRPIPFRRAHSVPFTPRKVLPLPDDMFNLLLRTAYERWGDIIADGDKAYAPNPEKQRGALFCRNTVILLALRFEGARRSETPFITLEDIDRERSVIRLVTKGRGGESGNRLPVVLNPLVEQGFWIYETRFRPKTEFNSVRGYPVLVNHGTRNYGKKISAQCVRKVIDALRDCLPSPWDERVTPHTLRHSFSVDLQKEGGEAIAMVNMRHASLLSLNSYFASPEAFSDKLLGSSDKNLSEMLARIGIPVPDWAKVQRV